MLIKRESKINGFGIFSNTFIAKNSKFYNIPLDEISSNPEPKCARVGEGKYVSDSKVLNWVNHSCNPNSKLDLSEEPVLVSLKDISQNEEITVDYTKTELNNKKITCNCHSKKCKGYFFIS